MSIRKKILLLFALLISLTGYIAWRGYEAYIDIIKQHEIVDLNDETTNAATRLSEAILFVRLQAGAVGGETVVRNFLLADDAAKDAQRQAAEQRLGELLQQPGMHYVRARLLDDKKRPGACVVRKNWQAFAADETTLARADRVARETPDSIEFVPCDPADPQFQVAAVAAVDTVADDDDGATVSIVHSQGAPLLTALMPIELDGRRVGYIEVARDIRYDVLDDLNAPRVVTIITNSQGVPVLACGDPMGKPATNQPLGQYFPELKSNFESTATDHDSQLITDFRPTKNPALEAYGNMFQHSFLVARYPESERDAAELADRKAMGEKIELALAKWSQKAPGRRYFNTAESLPRDSRIVVCAATEAELAEAEALLREASGDVLQIDNPRNTTSFAVQFLKIYWDANDRTHYLGLLRAASIQEIEADVSSELRRKTYLALILVPVALAMIAAWGPGFIARPLTKITRGAERISRGDLQKVEVPETNDEIERLALAFNDMVSALSERRELKAANEQLEKAKRDLERAQTSREEFLASVSHELRTPLTTVLGFCLRLLKTDLTARQHGDVERIQSAGERLLRLVKDILDYQKVVMGRLPLEPHDFDLAALTREVVEESQSRATEKGLVLRLECAVDKLEIHADPIRVRQVLDNLVGNSIKFTQKGEIVCRVGCDSRNGKDLAVVEVQDTGRGMTEEQQEQLFRPFTKFLEHSENPTGTGLGLAICRGICRTSGGDVRADPSRTIVGKGSTFIVELPMPTSEPVGLSTTYTAPPPRKAEAISATTGCVSGRNIALVIDDDPDVVELLTLFFKEHDFDVAVATEGVRGLEEAKRLRPCLITLDVQMPGLDGWQVLRLLKSEPATANIPVVLVTIADDKQRGFAMGATDYLSKPIDWDRLGGLIERFHNNGCAGKVLVVEDDADQRELLAAGLRSRGCEVVEAVNGRRALEALEDFTPDLILLDLIMPEMDGFQFLSALRDHSELRDATVVVVSGKELDEADYDRLRGQVADIIAKSEATWSEIQRELQRLLKLHLVRATVPEESTP